MSIHENELIPTRASLLTRLKDAQNHSAWQEFFDTYWKLIYGVARTAGLTDAEAQDVVLETMASVAKHMPTFKYDPARGSFKAWMLNKTRWLIIDHFREREPLLADRRAPSTTATGTGMMEQLVDPRIESITEVFEAEWEKDLMEKALMKVKRRVDPQKYQIFDFCVNKEWPSEKVAAQFAISVGQVYVDKHRIIEMIKTEVERLKQETI